MGPAAVMCSRLEEQTQEVHEVKSRAGLIVFFSTGGCVAVPPVSGGGRLSGRITGTVRILFWNQACAGLFFI